MTLHIPEGASRKLLAASAEGCIGMNEKLTVGMSRCRCSGCGHYFNSVAAFDEHRIGNIMVDGVRKKIPRRCLTVEEMDARGMAVNSSGYWVREKWEGIPSLKSQDAA